MEYFDKLGALVESRWRARQYDENVFPEIAETALNELPPAANVATYEPLLGVVGLRKRRAQSSDGETFGEPPVRVFETARFYIEALYWLDGTTAIHEHAFNGAFHVMAGSSIHCRYSFTEARRYNSQMKIGRVQRDQIEILRKGDTRQILPSQQMTHSLFHLDRPSVTVVIRTDRVPGSDPQYSYLMPSIAYDPFSDHMSKDVLTALDTLAEVAHPEFDQIAAELFRQADPHLFMCLALRLTSAFATPARILAAMEASRDQRAELVEAVIAAWEEQRRADRIRELRAKLHSADQRFFLALLLHIASGAELLTFVAQQYPRQEPRELLLRWIAECAASPDPADSSKTVMNLHFDPAMLDVMKPMLAGGSLDDVMNTVRQQFDPEDVAEQSASIARLHKALCAHPIFGPLFR